MIWPVVLGGLSVWHLAQTLTDAAIIRDHAIMAKAQPGYRQFVLVQITVHFSTAIALALSALAVAA